MSKIKYILAFFYIIFIGFFLYKSGQILEVNSLDNFSFQKIQDKLNEFKKENYYLLIIYFFFFSLVWTLFLGFISPLLLMAGYLLSPIQGAIIVSLANSISGAILIAIVRSYFMNDISKFFTLKIKKIINFIERDINMYFFIFRLAGGFGAPSQVQNLIPSLTKINILNYIVISLIGCLPIYYISTSIGHSLNFISDIKNLDISIFSNLKFLSTLIIIVIILIGIRIIKKRYKF